MSYSHWRKVLVSPNTGQNISDHFLSTNTFHSVNSVALKKFYHFQVRYFIYIYLKKYIYIYVYISLSTKKIRLIHVNLRFLVLGPP